MGKWNGRVLEFITDIRYLLKEVDHFRKTQLTLHKGIQIIKADMGRTVHYAFGRVDPNPGSALEKPEAVCAIRMAKNSGGELKNMMTLILFNYSVLAQVPVSNYKDNKIGHPMMNPKEQYHD